MSVYDEYETDAQAEVDGVWHTYSGGFKLRIARAGGSNKFFTIAIATRAAEFQDLSAQEMAEAGMMADVYAEAVVKEKDDPNGELVTREGKEIEIGSPEMGQALRDLKDLYREIQNHAMDRKWFRPLGAQGVTYVDEDDNVIEVPTNDAEEAPVSSAKK
jgi:hypothetical protein